MNTYNLLKIQSNTTKYICLKNLVKSKFVAQNSKGVKHGLVKTTVDVVKTHSKGRNVKCKM